MTRTIKSFTQDIFLLETYIAGLRYYDIKNLPMPLQLADALLLRREPGNIHDELAIAVLTLTKQKLGYVPKFRNPVLARLMDAGKSLAPEVVQIKLVIVLIIDQDCIFAFKREYEPSIAVYFYRPMFIQFTF